MPLGIQSQWTFENVELWYIGWWKLGNLIWVIYPKVAVVAMEDFRGRPSQKGDHHLEARHLGDDLGTGQDTRWTSQKAPTSSQECFQCAMR